MTERVEIPPPPVPAKLLKRKKAAQALQLLAVRWLPEPALTLPVRVWTPQMLRKRKPELREWLQELAWLRLENPLALEQVPRAAKPSEQPGHWLQVPAGARWRLREPVV